MFLMMRPEYIFCPHSPPPQASLLQSNGFGAPKGRDVPFLACRRGREGGGWKDDYSLFFRHFQTSKSLSASCFFFSLVKFCLEFLDPQMEVVSFFFLTFSLYLNMVGWWRYICCILFGQGFFFFFSRSLWIGMDIIGWTSKQGEGAVLFKQSSAIISPILGKHRPVRSCNV